MSITKYYQGFVSFINESVMEDSQALISPDTRKLGDSQKPVRQISDKARRFKNIDLKLQSQMFFIRPVWFGESQSTIDS